MTAVYGRVSSVILLGRVALRCHIITSEMRSRSTRPYCTQYRSVSALTSLQISWRRKLVHNPVRALHRRRNATGLLQLTVVSGNIAHTGHWCRECKQLHCVYVTHCTLVHFLDETAKRAVVDRYGFQLSYRIYTILPTERPNILFLLFDHNACDTIYLTCILFLQSVYVGGGAYTTLAVD